MNEKQINLEFIKKRMSEKGVRQKDIADLTGLSKVSISTILTGKSKMTALFALALSDALELSNAEILEVFFGRKGGVE